MIECFEVGKYYVWKGPTSGLSNWVSEMDAVFDGLPHECLQSEYGGQRAFLSGVNGGFWSWSHVFKYFDEVKPSRSKSTTAIDPGKSKEPLLNHRRDIRKKLLGL